MKEKPFQEYLLNNNVSQKQISIFISRLNEFNTYLNKKNSDIDSIQSGGIIKYSEFLVKKDNDAVLDFLMALINYANFIKKYDYVIEIIDISESYNAMENLYQRVGEECDKKIQDEIFENIAIPPLGVHPERKPEFTKIVMKRLEEKLGKEKTISLLKPCLHGRPGSIKEDREKFLELNDIDDFLKVKKQELIKRLRKHQKESTLEFAQYIDEEVIEFVKNNPTISPGKREGNIIINTKIPYQIKNHLNVKDERMKRYYTCYCPWVRGALKNGTSHEISSNFCQCSAGYTKLYWDTIFDQSTKVEPIETPLSGALFCKFAVHIPKDFQK
ncbi:MAG: hypothetical protein ACFFB0_02535 [Promethearchaeota archaeon]